MLSAAERSHPTSEVRGRSWEDLMPKGRRPRGVTSRPRSGQRLRVLDWDGAGTAERSYHIRGQGWWLRGPSPHPRSPGCVGAGGLEELSHVEGQEGRG